MLPDPFFILQFGFTFTILLIMILKIIIPSKKTIINKWYLIANWVVFLFFIYLSIANIIYFIKELSEFNTEKEVYTFYYTRLNFFSPYGWSHYPAIFLPFILCLLFLKKKVRASLLWSLAVIIFFNLENIVIFITGFYRDYLSSSWSVFYTKTWQYSYIQAFLIFTLAVLIVILADKIIIKKYFA
ncbi:hypothetical protein FRZ67_09945 [Panacibacter ginsenosidivorans]|uniref:Uncharacterized protein n=1 Tax=Panacibacter ginsenosidivorans TaxID=1813871 RepID=A0A5B8V8X9_9BACT|nr:hypothetical protein [Panacibacter ginsenosidivorans]QEC67595.1 hypothetical protein FRZ67_09945 [Panacibacter ginsenosidivorans]